MPPPPKKKVSRRSLLRAFGFGAASSVLPVAYGDVSSRWLSVEHHELKLPKWDADGFRVLVMADFHANSESDTRRAQEAVKIALSEKVDLIALPGDFIDASDDRSLENVRTALAGFREAKCPVVATMGNHDYWVHDPSKVISTLRDCPVRLLRNEAVEVDGVTVAGVDDAIAGRHRPEFLRSPRHSKSLLTLFHEPDFVVDVPDSVSLQLSGHSHGGQVCLPGGIPVHTPHGAKKYIRGFYPDAPAPLYVTRGVGTTGPDLRLFCRPEIAVLTLKGA